MLRDDVVISVELPLPGRTGVRFRNVGENRLHSATPTTVGFRRLLRSVTGWPGRVTDKLAEVTERTGARVKGSASLSRANDGASALRRLFRPETGWLDR